MHRQSTPPLGPGLWLFVATRLIGIILNAVFLAFFVIWARPSVRALEELGGNTLGDVLLPVVEIIGTVIGLALIFRRAPIVRRYWLVYLNLFCLAQVWQALVGFEIEGPLFFLVAGLGWLAYWLWAPRPRQLPLEGFWVHPDPGGE